jgi:cystathionine gamma-lyase
VYGGTQRYLRRVAVKGGLKTDLIDMTDLRNVEKWLMPETKLVWIESPTNPLLKVIDIRAVCETVRRLQPNALIAVDNTFMTPYFQRPLSLGADIVVHSITKYLNGHVDVVMGCTMTNDEKIAEHFKFHQMAVGANPSPFDCYLVNRGVKTLHLRMKAHYENALTVAKYLEEHPCVERVNYPALPSHPQHEIHKKQSKGMSGMMSFYLRGNLNETIQFLKHLKVFALAESLGGYESLAEHPALMTHASVPAEERVKLGIGDNLIRLSVGVEDVEDLIADLEQAFDKLKLHREVS